MRYSLIISLAIHAAILLAAFIVLPSPDAMKAVQTDIIPVDIVSIEDVSKRVATVKVAEPKPVEQPQPPKPVVEETKPEPKLAQEVKTATPEPQSEPPPVPVPAAKMPDPKPMEELIKKTEDIQPKPETKSAEAPPVKPKPRPEKPKKKDVKPLDIDKVQALLNKLDDKAQAPPKPTPQMGQPLQGAYDFASGSDDRMAADLVDWLRKKIEECWNPPMGVQEAQNLIIKLKIELDQNGNVIGEPEVQNSSMDPLFGVASASAVRAVLRCQPYDRLPPDQYENWRSIILNFDPSQMFSG